MLLDWSTGDSGLGLPGAAVHNGMTNLVRFSYRANNRSMLVGECCPFALDFEVDEVYAIIFLESNLPTS